LQLDFRRVNRTALKILSIELEKTRRPFPKPRDVFSARLAAAINFRFVYLGSARIATTLEKKAKKSSHLFSAIKNVL
jgi:hypothetical protein